MSESFELPDPDYFTTGAVGQPGQRVFYMQGRQARRVVTLKVEKEQIAALADYVAGVLAKLPVTGAANTDLQLLEPIDAVWAVGALGLGYDEAADRVVVVANEAVEQDDEDDDKAKEEGATARFLVTRAQAAAFVERARSLVRAGRPICPMCSQPKDPSGHTCPRSNGHVVHKE